jgi:uncharacterized protein YjiS (DUF1127 family)
MKPSSSRLLNDPVASIESPIRWAAVDVGRLVRGPLKRLSVYVWKRLERAAQHRSLQSLDDNMLKDIGVSRCDVEREIRFGGHGETRTDNPHRLFSHDLYFRARHARTQAMSDALESVFANASRYVRRRSRIRDDDRHPR